MATPEHIKRRSMDAISHPETAAQMRLFGATAPSRELKPAIMKALPGNLKRQAMDAVSSLETVAQVGVMKATGGIAVYVARIREVDRDNRLRREPNRHDKPYYKRSQGFLRE